MPCAGRASPLIIFSLLARGAAQVAVFACGDHDCRFGRGAQEGRGAVEIVRHLLAQLGENPQRVLFVQDLESLGAAAVPKGPSILAPKAAARDGAIVNSDDLARVGTAIAARSVVGRGLLDWPAAPADGRGAKAPILIASELTFLDALAGLDYGRTLLRKAARLLAPPAGQGVWCLLTPPAKQPSVRLNVQSLGQAPARASENICELLERDGAALLRDRSAGAIAFEPCGVRKVDAAARKLLAGRGGNFFELSPLTVAPGVFGGGVLARRDVGQRLIRAADAGAEVIVTPCALRAYRYRHLLREGALREANVQVRHIVEILSPVEGG